MKQVYEKSVLNFSLPCFEIEILSEYVFSLQCRFRPGDDLYLSQLNEQNSVNFSEKMIDFFCD